VNLVVLDSSAVLALLHGEAGADLIQTLVMDAVLCSVNAAEVQTRLVRKGAAPERAWESVTASVRAILPFDGALAESAGSMIRKTQPYGLSLGDRACLALAMTLKAPVYTTDRAWAQLQVGVEVRLVR
jgi:PIN domain nuclease of toxin-antitoxin system